MKNENLGAYDSVLWFGRLYSIFTTN